MRLLRRISIGLLLVLISLYLFLPSLAKGLLQYDLQQNNIKLMAIELQRPSFQQISELSYQISHASFKLADDSTLQLSDVQLVASPKSAIAYDLKIGSVKLSQANTSKTTVAPELDLQSALPSSFIKKLPSVRLSIASISISSLPVHILQIEALLSAQKINASATLSQLDLTSASVITEGRISLELNATNQFKLNFHDNNGQLSSALTLQLAFKDQLLQGHAELTQYIKHLSALANEDQPLNLSDNKLSLAVNFSLPAHQKLSLNTLKSLTLNGQFELFSSLSRAIEGSSVQLHSQAKFDSQLNDGLWKLTLRASRPPIIRLNGQLQALHPVLAKLNTSQAELALSIDKSMSATASIDSVGSFKIEQGQARISLKDGAEKLLTLTLAELNIQPASQSTFGLQADLNINNPNKRWPELGFSARSLKANLVGHILWQNEQLTLSTHAGNQLSLQSVKQDDSSAQKISLKIPKQDILWASKKKQLARTAFTLQFDQLLLGNKRLNRLKIDNIAHFKRNQLSLNSIVQATELKLADKLLPIPTLNLNSNLKLAGSKLQAGSLNLSNACQQPIIQANWQAGSSPNQSNLALSWQHKFSADHTLKHWLNSPSLPLNVESGLIAGAVDIQFIGNQSQLKNIRLSLKDIQASHQLGLFSGVQLNLKSGASKNSSRIPPLSLKAFIKEADLGFKLNNIDLKSSFSQRQNGWHLSNPSSKANIFSGTLQFQQKSLQLDDDIKINIGLDNINLGELVATQQIDELQVSGKISGQVPLRYHAGQVSVSAGEVHSLSAGNISYSSPLIDSNGLNEQLKLVLEVLQNFNYSKLNSQLSYNNDTLQLNSSIIGKSPEVSSNRAIEFNLNTELGLAGSIKALRLQSGLESQIEELAKVTASPKANSEYCN